MLHVGDTVFEMTVASQITFSPHQTHMLGCTSLIELFRGIVQGRDMIERRQVGKKISAFKAK